MNTSIKFLAFVISVVILLACQEEPVVAPDQQASVSLIKNQQRYDADKARIDQGQATSDPFTIHSVSVE
ncbi:MAG: hypothetical protein ACR2MX_10255, partial [Cyclobacteriaceae bacterium]